MIDPQVLMQKLMSEQFLLSSIKILVILFGAMILLRTLKWTINRLISKSEAQASARVETLSAIALTAIKSAVWFMTILVILSELGIDLAPILATAGVLGLAIGFGAQELVKDVISGFFILLEDQLRVGNIVDLDGNSGVVEKVGLRTIKLRDVTGTVHYVRNGGISVVKNLTRDFSYYVSDLGVGYGSNIDQVIGVIKRVGEELQATEHGKDIMDPVEVFGLDQFGDSAVVVKCRVKTQPGKQWSVGREFNRRIKLAFDTEGVEIPFPQRTLHMIPAPN